MKAAASNIYEDEKVIIQRFSVANGQSLKAHQ